jgi:diketogulonate reductase-like aldo/keto reductase
MPLPSGTSIASRVRLNQGPEIPWLGLGVFQSEPGSVTRNAVTYALEAGYRAIDTAAMYRNEADVGEAVRHSGLARDEVFVTTKLWHTDHGFDPALKAGRASAERLGLGPIDLYLIHWPRANSPQDRLDSWKALAQLQREGVCRAVGVSNYTVRHLENCVPTPTSFRPSTRWSSTRSSSTRSSFGIATRTGSASRPGRH